MSTEMPMAEVEEKVAEGQGRIWFAAFKIVRLVPKMCPFWDLFWDDFWFPFWAPELVM